MKKAVYLVLALVMVMSFTACGGSGDGGGDSDFAWSREGYYIDEAGNQLMIMKSEYEDEYPGWYVGLVTEDLGLVGWYIEQDGETLHGNINPEGDELVVTVAEEGEDGILLTADATGEEYHFVVDESPEAAIQISINIDGIGEIAYAPEGETLEFDEDFPTQSAVINLDEPATYQLAAKPDEGYKFVKWTKSGEDFSTDAEITVEFSETAEYRAVFEAE